MIYWNYLLFNFMKKATFLNDTKMKNIVKELGKVPLEVRSYLLSKYAEQCKLLHLVAFMQWRLYYCKSNKNHETIDNFKKKKKEELLEMIVKIMRLLEVNHKRILQSINLKEATIRQYCLN